MPLYVFEDIETGRQFEEMMSYDDSVVYLETNPNLKRVPCAPRLISGTATEIKIDGGFKEVLQRTAAQNPTSPLAAKHGDKGIKASKTREVINKHWGRKPD